MSLPLLTSALKIIVIISFCMSVCLYMKNFLAIILQQLSPDFTTIFVYVSYKNNQTIS